MKPPELNDLDLFQKKVLLRADLDVDIEKSRIDKRLEILLPTLEYLNNKECEIIVLGHRGRPEFDGDRVRDRENLSLEPVSQILENLLKEKWGEDKVGELKMQMMENLRFNQEEEENDQEFAKNLAQKGDVYINEAFSVSHRRHASIVGIPKYLPHAAGIRFIAEIENLSKVLNSPAGEPKRPLVCIISGVKEDKLDYIEGFVGLGDKVLIAGRLPEYLEINTNKYQFSISNEKLIVADLNPDKEDITIRSIEKFEEEIAGAGTIVLAGPIGKFEDEGHKLGTKRVFEAVVNNKSAFKVAGGGDTEKAISALGLSNGFDWISVGGGAMLEFLANRTLPGVEALLH